MANQDGKDMRSTKVGGSDVAFEAICDPCHFVKQLAEAKGYCTSCKENLCDECINVHGKMPTLRSHVIETKMRSKSAKARSRGGAASSRDADPLTDKCEQHQHETVSFYCNSHKALGCGECLRLNHKSCTDVSYIRNVSGNIANSDELKNVRTELKRLSAYLKYKGRRSDGTKKAIELRCDQALEEIDKFEDEIITYVRKVADDVRQDAIGLRDEALKQSDEQAAACTELVEDTDKMATDVETRSRSGLNNSLFVAIKRTESKLPGMQKRANNISNRVPIRFVFKSEKRINDVIASKVRLGTLTTTDSPRVAEYVIDVNVMSAGDTSSCLINGMCAVPGDRLVITDHHNKAVKVLDIKKREITDQISTSSKPLRVAAMEDDEVAITLLDEQIIQVFSLVPRLVKSRDIKVNYPYTGIAYTSDKLALTLNTTPPTKIHILDVSGSLLLSIDTTMADPRCITLSPDLGVMYVSDFAHHEVACFTMSGEGFNTYTNKYLKAPKGMAVDEDSCVYICSDETHSLHRMVPGTNIAGPILTGSGSGIGMAWVGGQCLTNPQAVAYSDNHLYISSSSADLNISKYIKVFKLR